MNRTMMIVCCASLMAASAAAQRRVRGAEKPTLDVTIALKAGADAYQFKGQARCTHAPVAAIYNVVSEQWTVQQADDQRSLTLTLWKPKDGAPAMFSLSLSSGNRSRSVNTVKGNGAPGPAGSGSIT